MSSFSASYAPGGPENTQEGVIAVEKEIKDGARSLALVDDFE